MSAKDINTEKDACLALAFEKWAVHRNVQPGEVPAGVEFIDFEGFTYKIRAGFTPGGVLIGTQRINLDNTTSSRLDMTQHNGTGTFARLVVRLSNPEPVDIPADLSGLKQEGDGK